MLPIMGPAKFVRDARAPKVFTARFANCETSAKYKIVVVNGGPGGSHRVESARISLNGTVVVTARDFHRADDEDRDDDFDKANGGRQRPGPSVARIEKPVIVGADNDLRIRITGKPRSFVTVSVECTGNCLDLAITRPASCATLTQSTVAVVGQVSTASSEAGVTINGMPASVDGSRFALTHVPVTIGSNVLVVEATNACSSRARRVLKCHVDALHEPTAQMVAKPAWGAVPLTVSFDADALADVPVASAEWDFDGDGVADESASTVTDRSYVYTTPGLYTPSLAVTDAAGVRTEVVLTVAAHSPAQLESRLQQRWISFHEALTAGDLDRALQHIAESTRPQYRRALLGANLAAVAGSLAGSPTLLEAHGGIAVLTLNQQFLVECVVDRDGLWRIRFF